MQNLSDGLEFVKSSLDVWYSEHLSKDLARQLQRQDTKPKDSATRQLVDEPEGELSTPVPDSLPILPEGLQLVEGEPILDRKSVFVGRACSITDPSQVGDDNVCF